jgi:protein SCO1/2
MYSVTLDPEHDTPKILKRYAKGFGVEPGWLFLTGDKSDIEALRRNLGDVDLDPVKDREKSTHIGMLRYGIEPLERWAACASLTRPEWIIKNVARMEPKGTRANAWLPKRPVVL